jgi:uncharacterized membrane protein
MFVCIRLNFHAQNVPAAVPHQHMLRRAQKQQARLVALVTLLLLLLLLLPAAAAAAAATLPANSIAAALLQLLLLLCNADVQNVAFCTCLSYMQCEVQWFRGVW